MTQRTKLFLLNHGPLLTTVVIFVLAYVIGGQLYPAMQKPQVFFNLMNAATNQIVVNVTPYIQQVASVANSLP